MNNYEDIINLKRPISKRLPMSMESRAAQFAPFSALVGYDEKIKEKSRYTDKQLIIDENKKEDINSKLVIINNNLGDVISIITYFEKDKTKPGGKYIKIKDKVKKIDMYNKIIVMVSGLKIKLDLIVDIELNDSRFL